jgi:diacylglycerol kinase family enzyme
MRVALLHNTSAGSEDHTDDELIKLIGRAGHEVVHVVNRSGALTAALQASPCDLVAVAGGDGTVGRAACELSDWGIPLGILPLGTANNTALTLGLSAARMKKLIKSWGAGTKLPFDLALLDDGAVRQRFSEGVGWGVFAATVKEAKQRPALDRPARQLKRDRKLFRGVVESTAPRPYRVEVDGRDCSGDYLMVEIMNVPFLGPQLEVSPSSNPGDGELEVVLVGAEDRELLEGLSRTGKSARPLPCERGKHIRVRTADALMHRDGGLLRHAPGERDFEISVCPGAVQYLR